MSAVSLMEPDYTDWIGRTETREGGVTPNLAGMLDAAVSHDLSPVRDVRAGMVLPSLWHWVAFPEFVPMSELGDDGHPALGGFLPPLPFRRRMWAGGDVRFKGVLHVGEALSRVSTIRAVTQKAGKTGPMAFVTVDHVTTGEQGGVIEEEQNIVYLNIPQTFRPPRQVPVPDRLACDERVSMNEVRLFRYSAATYNAHRIHYDLTYAQQVEKYPALVVHGPMQATMAIEAAERHTGRPPAQFTYRVVHPMFHDSDMRLVGALDPAGGAIEIGTATFEDYLGLQARMEWAT
ncbi:FAS1-like dehydratase domain-containing protein [Antarctobacter heliothermus]|uniref:3-methylfumaryl-CoA hydratase n=1 Tax=Antarctobacter heliothermus TaxID=74033 RepID=A0A239JHI2_9RHOB|nr:MaoC family dehydratase N-terminal domain-containing protein [Antarctobacter heliothermus]SNT04888.1 3-methylfumaryl-CoA hydratase [Antarctobacter heliothermus]